MIKPPTDRPRKTLLLVLCVAGAAGFCTMSYEVLWFRVLKYFVDNSIQSFSIMLTTFLFGLTVGGFLISRFVDSRKDKYLLLGAIEIAIGFLSLLSIPVISETNNLIGYLNRIFGTGWGAEIVVRFTSFSFAMLLPTALMGGAFPVFGKIYSGRTASVGKSIGEVYGVNTIGGVLGSFAAGFVLIPVWGVQNSIVAISCTNVFIGVLCLCAGSSVTRTRKSILAGTFTVLAFVLIVTISGNAFAKVYSSRYPPPRNDMLYCKENVNGTTTVFQDTRQTRQRFMLIDGTGEVSTDYFSMRAFRFLSLLPAIYSPSVKSTLVVTFGSGIVAGSIAELPGCEHVDCVEICKEAFDAAAYFSQENHDVLHNPKVNLIVNDGRNYVFTTNKQYDIISADATHPTSSDSWILYTREFYGMCKSKLTDDGIMCQWIPLHGILESDYKMILQTFCSVFPHAALYYSGGRKTVGHTVLLGSKKAMNIDMRKATELLRDTRIREDLEQVNVFTLYDLLNCFVMDRDGINAFSEGARINTDDRPSILFSKFDLHERPSMGISGFMKYRRSVFPQLIGMNNDSIPQIQRTVDKNFEAMSNSMAAEIMEFEEFTARMKQNFEGSREETIRNLEQSRAMLEQAILNYEKAIDLNPFDYHTKYLLSTISREYEYLNSFLQKISPG